jgi:hypothetical protein
MAENAGHLATVNMTGTSTAMSAEACSLVSGKTYQIDNTAKRIIDPDVAVVVDDGGSPVSASDIESIDYLFGKVTFVGSYTPSGAITIDANYLPVAAVAYAKEYSFSKSTDMNDFTVFGNTSRKRSAGLKDSSGSIGFFGHGEDTVGANTLEAKLAADTEYLFEFSPASGAKRRVWGFLTDIPVNADPSALVEATLTWEGSNKTSQEGYEVSLAFEEV